MSSSATEYPLFERTEDGSLTSNSSTTDRKEAESTWHELFPGLKKKEVRDDYRSHMLQWEEYMRESSGAPTGNIAEGLIDVSAETAPTEQETVAESSNSGHRRGGRKKRKGKK